MYQFFVEENQINVSQKRAFITGPDVNHIKNVLRMKPGEEISVSNGVDGKEYRLGILELTDDVINCELRFIKEDGAELPVKVTLFQGLPKADKMEMIIQKCVELGVTSIVPVATKRAVMKLEEKKAASKIARWQSIAEAAAKQSKRGIIPNVEMPMTFKEAVAKATAMDVKLIPYELAEDMPGTREIIEAIKPGETIAIFIGPEGGFDPSEIDLALDNGITPITLGKRILRTETAGLTIMSWIMYQMDGKN